MMTQSAAHLYVIAGSNGAGKTTFAREFLPSYARCLRFINPDMIAAGLSPFDPPAAALVAARVVLSEVRRSILDGASFAFESTLSGRSYLGLMRLAKASGFMLHLFYLWIPGPDLALARITDRVEAGGHGVPETDVRRRYPRSLHNFFSIYAPVADTVHFFDNSGSSPALVFLREDGVTTVLNPTLYATLTRETEHER